MPRLLSDDECGNWLSEKTGLHIEASHERIAGERGWELVAMFGDIEVIRAKAATHLANIHIPRHLRVPQSRVESIQFNRRESILRTLQESMDPLEVFATNAVVAGHLVKLFIDSTAHGRQNPIDRMVRMLNTLRGRLAALVFDSLDDISIARLHKMLRSR